MNHQEVKTFEAEVAQLYATKVYPEATLRQMKINAQWWAEDLVEEIVFTFRTQALTDRNDHVDIDLKWPKDWWQAFKERWAPKFIKRRWPVQYEEYSYHKVFPRRICPHIEVPEKETHLAWLTMGDVA